ncbi:hypothetical protein [Pontibaca salina]|uniref:Uncharacterized protein n=1 Tax=Pontibaca salina TaxID=2795731 RepID=A0A934HPU3_9RHOB|nr:hypothetical protein [Pontibaca salina]MBI6628355.1 hypothetical protein [Pontibaca salina]
MTPKELRALSRPKIRKLARHGKLMDTTFKVFQRAVYPGAAPDQVNALRIAFFAGAQEINALLLASLDEEEDPTNGDLDFMSHWRAEIERFQERAIAVMKATRGRAN